MSAPKLGASMADVQEGLTAIARTQGRGLADLGEHLRRQHEALQRSGTAVRLPQRLTSVESWERECARSLAQSRERRESPHPFPLMRVGVILGILLAVVFCWLFAMFLGAADAAPRLSSAGARSAALSYERAYWAKQAPGASVRLVGCRRRSAVRVRCTVEAVVQETPTRVTRIETHERVTLERDGIVRVHPSADGLFATEETLS
jgi:hypothetical protein